VKRFESWLLGLSTLVVGGTGIALYVMKEWMSAADPFAVVHHPWQPWMLRIHLVAVPLLIFGFGLLVRGHVVAKLADRTRAGWLSGLGTLLLFGPMAVSGVLIQMLTTESWVRVTVWVHLLTGLTYLAGFGAHWLRAWAARVPRRARVAVRSADSVEPTVEAEGPVCR